MEAYDNPKLDAKTHDGIGAALLCYQHSDKISSDTSMDWRTFHIFKD